MPFSVASSDSGETALDFSRIDDFLTSSAFPSAIHGYEIATPYVEDPQGSEEEQEEQDDNDGLESGYNKQYNGDNDEQVLSPILKLSKKSGRLNSQDILDMQEDESMGRKNSFGGNKYPLSPNTQSRISSHAGKLSTGTSKRKSFAAMFAESTDLEQEDTDDQGNKNEFSAFLFGDSASVLTSPRLEKTTTTTTTSGAMLSISTQSSSSSVSPRSPSPLGSSSSDMENNLNLVSIENSLDTTFVNFGIKEHLVVDDDDETDNPYERAIPEWDLLEHVDIIHRQGLQPPQLVVQLCGGTKKEPDRPFFKVFLPFVSDNQSVSCLCCRKKMNKNILRMSLDPENLSKKNNPLYVGKLEANQDWTEFMVIQDNNNRKDKEDKKCQLASITLTEEEQSRNVRRTKVTLEILDGNFKNQYEQGKNANQIQGYINTYVQPMLTMQTMEEPSSTRSEITKRKNIRDVLMVSKEGQDDGKQLSNGAVSEQGKYLLDMDYPLTVFLAFCVFCAVEAKQLN